MKHLIASSIAVVLTLPMLASPALAESGAGCRDFSFVSTGEHRERFLSDLDESGEMSAGDKLLGRRDLVDEKTGEKIGERYFVGHVHEVNAEGREWRRSTEIINVLSEGTLFATKQLINGKWKVTEVTGGTGIYAGVKGTETSTKVDGSNVYRVQLNCSKPEPS